MSDVEDEHLPKFYPMEKMADRDFAFRGLSIISEDLQKLLDAWLPAYGGSPEHHEVDDAYWDLVANIRVCEAVGLLECLPARVRPTIGLPKRGLCERAGKSARNPLFQCL